VQQLPEAQNPIIDQESNGLEQNTFAELYRSYSLALYVAINKVLRNSTQSEGALQNTFIKIWLHRNSYDSVKGSPFTWMLNIAHNEALDVLRSKHHKQQKATTTFKEGATIAYHNPFGQLDNMDVRKLLFKLKPMDRTILELCFFRGFTCVETAQILNLPCGTVKTRMQWSYRKLKQVINSQESSLLSTD
jgi:RNA polymerase sigma-70 factor (ECF subfamily)